MTLVLISEISGVKINELGRRRIRDKVPLKVLAEEAGLDYVTLYKTVQVLKKALEEKGDKNLPPPLYPKKKEEKESESWKRKR